jgi:hypothetical protein
VEPVGDDAACFLQIFAGAADIDEVGDNASQRRLIDGALSLDRALAQQGQDNAPRQLLLFEKFLKA